MSEPNPVLSELDDRSQRPIFVIGCNRSGTTLLRFILDSHPAIACPPESKYLAALPALFRYPRAVAGAAGLGAGLPEIMAGAETYARSFLDQYAKSKGKRRWADKTPDYHHVIEVLDSVFRHRPLYLFLVRHPLDVIPSLKGMLTFEFLNGRQDPQLVDAASRHGTGEYGAARYWLDVNQRLRVFVSCIPERVHLLHYEDLVTDSVTTLDAMFRFLGEDFDASQLDTIFTTEHDRGFEDFRIRGQTAIRTDRINTWHTWPEGKREALWSLVEPLATRFGYHIYDSATV
jgi:hypothetical protein